MILIGIDDFFDDKIPTIEEVCLLIKDKFKGDIRTAPALERENWHQSSYITAPANSWFVCS